MITQANFVKISFFYRIDKKPTILIMPQLEFNKNIQRFVSRKGIYKYNNTKVDLTIVNKIHIEFFSDVAAY